MNCFAAICKHYKEIPCYSNKSDDNLFTLYFATNDDVLNIIDDVAADNIRIYFVISKSHFGKPRN